MDKQTQIEIAEKLLFQRPDMLGRKCKLNSRWKKVLPYHFVVRWDAKKYHNEVIADYRAAVEREWESIEAHLPEKMGTVLDIGCGIGGIHEITHRVFGPDVQIFLADKNSVDEKVYYGYEDQGSGYNSLPLAKSFLVNYQVPEDHVHLVDVDEDEMPDEKYDLVLSMYSWGLHYPVETYLDYVRDHLKPGGVVILDCRENTGGRETLCKHFSVEDISGPHKSVRYKCTLDGATG